MIGSGIVSGHNNVFNVLNGKWPSTLYAMKEETQKNKLGFK